MKKERIMVIGCHALDYLSKSGGVISQAIRQGSAAKVICLTCGERGEANAVWKEDAEATEEKVREIKRGEAMKAAKILGADIEFMNFKDHCLEMSQEKIHKVSEKIREFAPTVFLTHFMTDQANPDHVTAGKLALSALSCAWEDSLRSESRWKGLRYFCLNQQSRTWKALTRIPMWT